MNQDHEHLRLLSIFHYIHGVLMGLSVCLLGCFASFPLGLPLALAADSGPEGEVLGWITVALVGCFGICLPLGLGLAILMTGSNLTSHTGHTFCFIVACIECLSMPIGTVLGVFTIVVLMRPSVKELFEKNSN